MPLNGLKTDDERIRDVSHIAKNPGSDLTVERLGELAGMSPRNFTRVFAREIGMTPGKFVEVSRLESARRYLEQSTMPVGEIAQACGYSATDGMRLAFGCAPSVSSRSRHVRVRLPPPPLWLAVPAVMARSKCHCAALMLPRKRQPAP